MKNHIKYPLYGFAALLLSFVFAVGAQAATLQISPASTTASVGDTITVSVLLDTQGQAIDGVDLHYLTYNPYYLQLQDEDASASGVQVKAGVLMPNTLTNSVDVVNGRIDFSQLTASGSTYTGNGTLVTLKFKALIAGNAKLDFNYSSGATTDSNVASGGNDVLSSVTNGQVTINYPTTPVTSTTPNTPGDPTSPSVPNPTGSAAVPLKLVNYNGTYYLIVNGVRHGITLPGMLFSYGFALNQAKIATAEDIALPEGEILLPGDGVLVKTATDKTVWLISGGERHGFTSATVFTALGFKFSQVLVVTAPELNKQARGANVDNGSAAHLPGINVQDGGTIYWIGYGGQRHPYPDLATYNSWNVPNDFTRVLPSNAADRAMPAGPAVVARVLQ